MKDGIASEGRAVPGWTGHGRRSLPGTRGHSAGERGGRGRESGLGLQASSPPRWPRLLLCPHIPRLPARSRDPCRQRQPVPPPRGLQQPPGPWVPTRLSPVGLRLPAAPAHAARSFLSVALGLGRTPPPVTAISVRTAQVQSSQRGGYYRFSRGRRNFHGELRHGHWPARGSAALAGPTSSGRGHRITCTGQVGLRYSTRLSLLQRLLKGPPRGPSR